MANILGISLGSRLLGMAVVYDGKLYDFRVRTFYGVWTESKRAEMLATIAKAVERYEVTAIAVKTPKPAHCSKYIRDLFADIRELSEQLHINLSICTISALKGRFNGPGRSNKRALMEAIIEKYPNHPQLMQFYARERSNKSAYHVKLFEAIACTELH